jgi:hypothetical protein
MPANILFPTENEAKAETFLREYVLDAVTRAEGMEICDGIMFAVNGGAHPEGDMVLIGVMSDVDEFVERECEQWESFREDGIIEGWKRKERTKEELHQMYGEQGCELAKRLLPLSAKMSKLAYEEFADEEFPSAVDAFPDEDSAYPTGWGLVLHHMAFADLDYSADEEIEMHLQGIEEDLRIIGDREGKEAAQTKIDALIESLERMRDKVGHRRPQS